MIGIMGNGRLKRLGKAATVSVLNQAVGSGTNFMFGLYLVRMLSHADFGLYSIGFSISLFFAGIGNALLLTQMVVNVPDKAPEQQAGYVASMGAADAGFCTLTFLSVLVGLPAAGLLSPWLDQYVEFGIAVAAASGAYHFKELFMRYAYTARKEVWALKVNVVIAVALAILVTSQYVMGASITVVGAFWLYAGAQMVGAVAGQMLTKLPFGNVCLRQMCNDVKEAWEGARWAVPTDVIYTLRGQAHTIVTAALAGPVGVAYLNATRLLITPANLVMPALSQVVLPRLAMVRTQEKRRVLQLGAQFTGAILAVSVFYSAILLLFLDPVTHIVLGNNYPPDLKLAFAWCVFVCVHVVCINGTMVAQVLRRFKSIMMLSIATVIIMMCAIYLFYKALGVPGIVYGMAAGDIFLAIIAWRLVAEECRD